MLLHYLKKKNRKNILLIQNKKRKSVWLFGQCYESLVNRLIL